MITWRGIDDPDRLDTAAVRIGSDQIQAVGTSRTAEYATSWRLETGPDWVTRELRVFVHGFGWSRSLLLERSSEGRWTSEVSSSGDVELPPAGLDDPAAVLGALDCDLGLCPLTNTMPICRLGLLDAEVAETPLVMAWVEVPSLRVLRSDQIYASALDRDGPKQVRYQSFSRDFDATLAVDDDGIVLHYPTLAAAVGRP